MSDAMDFWAEMEAPGPATVVVGGVELRRGSRVGLRPHPRGDVFDLALAGRVGVVQGIEQDAEGAVHVAVTLEDDPGRDLGDARFPGHRFFFGVDEVEPLAQVTASGNPTRRILVAGIGNIFLGDDGFGVEVVRRLAAEDVPEGVDVIEFGIRGMDLAYALGSNYDAVVLVDAAPLGQTPGTLTVLEPELDDRQVSLETHAMDPVRVLALARALGGVPPRTLVVACEPQNVMTGDPDEEIVTELSEPVQAAVDEAMRLVRSLVESLPGEALDAAETNERRR